MTNPTPILHQSSTASLAQLSPAFFAKAENNQSCIVKTGPASAIVKRCTVAVHGAMFILDDTPIAMPTVLTPGGDYFVFVTLDGWVVATDSGVAPLGYTPQQCRMIGGFHYSAVPVGTTPASGQFATIGQDVVWSQAMVDDITGINKYSAWDLHHKPACDNPAGMVFVPELKVWVDIYHTPSNHWLGTSRHNSNVASGTVLPLIPATRGGNGATAYPRMGWWEAAEIAASHGKRLLTEREFNNAMIGVTENVSLGGASETIALTQFEPRFTSAYGIHQATGNHWAWGEDHGQRDMGVAASAWAYRAVTGTPLRGQIYTETALSDVRVLLGGARDNGSYAGSRCGRWSSHPWHSGWGIGLRCACDHLKLV